MNRIVLAAVLSLACSSLVLAAPSVPTRGAVKGDIVRMNQFFHIEDDNLRVASIRWISPGDSLATTISNLPQMSSPTAPNGYLLFTVPQKNTSKNPQPAQYLKITVFYKDGTQADDGDGVQDVLSRRRRNHVFYHRERAAADAAKSDYQAHFERPGDAERSGISEALSVARPHRTAITSLHPRSERRLPHFCNGRSNQ